MNPESLQACSRAAMGYVLPKTHELCLPSVKTSGEKALAQVEQLQCQLQSLKDHMIACDIYDVMTVAMPEDVMSSYQRNAKSLMTILGCIQFMWQTAIAGTIADVP